MITKIKNKFIYLSTLALMLFTLSCDKDTPTSTPDPDDSLFYCLSLEHIVEGGGEIDYADNPFIKNYKQFLNNWVIFSLVIFMGFPPQLGSSRADSTRA